MNLRLDAEDIPMLDEWLARELKCLTDPDTGRPLDADAARRIVRLRNVQVKLNQAILRSGR